MSKKLVEEKLPEAWDLFEIAAKKRKEVVISTTDGREHRGYIVRSLIAYHVFEYSDDFFLYKGDTIDNRAIIALSHITSIIGI